MTALAVDFKALPSDWAAPCRSAIDDLNKLFVKNAIGVKLSAAGAAVKRAPIKMSIDPSIGKTAVHGKTRTVTTTDGRLMEARIGLPGDVVVNTPQGQRSAGSGLRAVIVAHELMHALMHAAHTSHLMARTMRVRVGDTAKGDKLEADGVSMPDIKLGQASVAKMKQLWK